MRPIEMRAATAFERQYGHPPVILASAPGRINLIGEHTDYNDGFVLPCAIPYRTAIALATGNNDLYSDDYAESRKVQVQPAVGTQAWSSYPSAVIWALRQTGVDVPAVCAAFAGEVPQGAGLSSSAAIEAATALALSALLHADLSRIELARLAQHAENGFIGVQSGIMDQFAVLLSNADHALLLDCRSLETESIPLRIAEAGLTLLIADTRSTRQLATSGYNTRRAECESAAQHLSLTSLRDATEHDMMKLSGVERQRVQHIITENARVLAAATALRQNDFATFGHLMFQSHTSLRNDYQVSTPQLDAFVSIAEEAGALGARLTGAGFGGCAIALLDEHRVEPLTQLTLERFKTSGFDEPAFYTVSPASGAEIVSQPQ